MVRVKQRSKVWDIHKILTLDGSPYAVMRQLEVLQVSTGKRSGGVDLQEVPTGRFKMEPLHEVIENSDEVAEELL